MRIVPLVSFLVLSASGCTVPRAVHALRHEIDSHALTLAEQARAPGGDRLQAAVIAAARRQLREVEAATDRAASIAEVSICRQRLESLQATEDAVGAALARQAALAREVESLTARYARSTNAPERRFVDTITAARERQLAVAPPEHASLEELLAAVREHNDAVDAWLIEASSAELPHVRERQAALQARLDALLPVVKADRDAAAGFQKRPLADAVVLLEDAASQLRAGAGPGGADPRIVQRAARAVDEAEAKVREAGAAFDLRPSPWFRMHTGFATLTPYVVRPARAGDPPGASFVLDESGDAPAFYVEADFLHRWAWLRDQDRTLPSGSGILGDHQWLAPTDHEIRLRFTDADTIDGSRSAAGGDWAADASVGWSMFEYEVADPERRRAGTAPRGGLNLEFNAGFVTDRGSTDAHGFVQAGLGSVWAFPIEVGKGVYLPATFFGGIYYGIHSFPRLDHDDAVYSASRRPYFNDLGALGIKVDVTYPLNQTIEFVIGGRLAGRFENDAPEDWSLFVGVSLPIGRLFGSAASAAGGQ